MEYHIVYEAFKSIFHITFMHNMYIHTSNQTSKRMCDYKSCDFTSRLHAREANWISFKSTPNARRFDQVILCLYDDDVFKIWHIYDVRVWVIHFIYKMSSKYLGYEYPSIHKVNKCLQAD